MCVVVYSPYVYFYQGIWYQSGVLVVPFTAVDYKITKKFKLNLSFSGVQQINDQILNYQVLIGAKTFLCEKFYYLSDCCLLQQVILKNVIL